MWLFKSLLQQQTRVLLKLVEFLNSLEQGLHTSEFPPFYHISVLMRGETNCTFTGSIWLQIKPNMGLPVADLGDAACEALCNGQVWAISPQKSRANKRQSRQRVKLILSGSPCRVYLNCSKMVQSNSFPKEHTHLSIIVVV